MRPRRDVERGCVTVGRLLAPAWARQLANDAEAEMLSSLRDALLPKLISGGLCRKRAEDFVVA
jgi:hypothetical protein